MKLTPIGTIFTCFPEKFGVPRQSLMVEEAKGVIKLTPDFSHPDMVLGLNEFSHIWIVFLFHQAQTVNHSRKWSPLISPPGLGAPDKVGMFASRSPHRPNPIGLSVVKLDKIVTHASHGSSGTEVHVSGVDILDESPVLDIKPYLPYADIVSSANSGWANQSIARYPVVFSPQADEQTMQLQESGRYKDTDLKKLMTEVLQWDPRPRSQREAAPMNSSNSVGKKFAFRLLDLDLHWVIVSDERLQLMEIRKV